MATKDPTTTPRYKVTSAIRRLWMGSRERQTALKLAGYRCERCGIKRSAAKGSEVVIEVHHRNGIDWDGIIDLIIERVLQRPDDYECLCRECHKQEHN